MQRLLIKWRTWKIDTPLNYGDFTLGGKPDGYSLSFRYNAARKWYVENCGVNILDQLVTEYVDEGRVTQEPRKDKLFAVIEFDEGYVTAEELAFDIANDYKDYSVRVLTSQEARTFLQDFTSCIEQINGITSTFTLRKESTDMEGNITPAYTLTL